MNVVFVCNKHENEKYLTSSHCNAIRCGGMTPFLLNLLGDIVIALVHTQKQAIYRQYSKYATKFRLPIFFFLWIIPELHNEYALLHEPKYTKLKS